MATLSLQCVSLKIKGTIFHLPDQDVLERVTVQVTLQQFLHGLYLPSLRLCLSTLLIHLLARDP